MLLIGPGSLYTSVIPNLLVPGIRELLQRVNGLKVYISNIAEQPGETDGFTIDDYVKTISKYGGSQIFDLVVANDRIPHEMPVECTLTPPGKLLESLKQKPIVWADLIDSTKPTRHDASKLASFLMDVYQNRNQYANINMSLRDP